jgi:hypothetical protein
MDDLISGMLCAEYSRRAQLLHVRRTSAHVALLQRVLQCQPCYASMKHSAWG